jgi:hypothetical protein
MMPDGVHALVGDNATVVDLLLVNIETRTFETLTLPCAPLSFAMAPNGSLAIVANLGGGSVHLL